MKAYLVFCCLVASVGLGLLGCDFGSPTAPAKRDCAAENGCNPNAPAMPLPVAEQQQWLDEARAEVSRDLGRAITTPDPRVIYVACPFHVPNSNFGDVCAAGVTLWREGVIQVMTFDPKRTGPLVKWEGKNYFYCTNGACGRAV